MRREEDVEGEGCGGRRMRREEDVEGGGCGGRKTRREEDVERRGHGRSRVSSKEYMAVVINLIQCVTITVSLDSHIHIHAPWVSPGPSYENTNPFLKIFSAGTSAISYLQKGQRW